MLMSGIVSISMIMGLTFMQMNHPLAMGLVLLMQTVLISLITGMMTKTFWFSYILFLVFLGGMLVLFIYVTSLASNEMFNISMKMTLMMMSILTLMMLMMVMINYSTMNSYLMMSNNEMKSLIDIKSFMPENYINLIKLYNFPNNLITIMLVNYLLVTLVAAVKITNVFYGPLRKN